MKKLLAIVASALTLGAFANSAADPVITADTSAVPSGTTCTVMAGDEEAFDFVTNGGDMTFELDESYVGRRVCLAVGGEEITDSTTANMGAANAKLAALKLAGEVNDQVVWSNFATTGVKTSWFTKGNNQCTFTLAAKDDCPIGATVTISEVRFASNAGRTWADTITINSVTSASKTTGDSGLDDFTEAEIYAFTEGVDVVVGTTYQLGTSGSIQLTGSIPTAGFQNPVFITGLTSPHTEKTAALCEVTATIKSLPARDPIAFTFDASTQTWDHELTEEFMIGDTIEYIGTGDATLSSNVTVPLTVGAGVNLTIAEGVTISSTASFAGTTTANGTTFSGETTFASNSSITTKGTVAFSGKSKFAAGSTLTIASGTTTISNAQDGTHTDRGLMGTIIVESGATLSVPKNDSINYDGTTKMVVKGTFNGGTARQTFNANNTIELHNGAKIEGTGAAYGQVYTAVLDINQNATFTVNGAAAINAPVGIRNGVTLTVKKAEGAETASVSINADNKILGPGAIIYEGISGMDKLPAKYATQGGKKITLKDCTGWINWARFDGEVTISGTFTIKDGSSSTAGTIKTLKGDGTIAKTWGNTPIIYIEEHSEFTGSVTATGVHLSRAKSESAYYYTIDAVKTAVDAETEVTNIDCTAEELGAGYEIVEGKIVPKATGPATIEDVTAENVAALIPEAAQAIDATALVAWIKAKSGISTIEGLQGVNVDAFLMNASNDTTELVIDENTLAAVLAGDLDALKAIYPNAEVTIEDVTSTICGEGADENTHLYQLKLSLPTAQD